MPEMGIDIASMKVATEKSPAPKPINNAPIKNNNADPKGADHRASNAGQEHADVLAGLLNVLSHCNDMANANK